MTQVYGPGVLTDPIIAAKSAAMAAAPAPVVTRSVLPFKMLAGRTPAESVIVGVMSCTSIALPSPSRTSRLITGTAAGSDVLASSSENAVMTAYLYASSIEIAKADACTATGAPSATHPPVMPAPVSTGIFVRSGTRCICGFERAENRPPAQDRDRFLRNAINGQRSGGRRVADGHRADRRLPAQPKRRGDLGRIFPPVGPLQGGIQVVGGERERLDVSANRGPSRQRTHGSR